MLYVLFMVISTQAGAPLAIPVRSHNSEQECIAERDALRADLVSRPRVASDVDLVCQIKAKIG